MKSTIESIKNLIQSYPTPQPIFTITVDYSGDLVFRHNSSVKSPFTNPTEIETLVQECIQVETVRNTNGTICYRNKVNETLSYVIESINVRLRDTLKRALPNQDPRRTNIFKWFCGYRPKSEDEQKLILLIYDYALNNTDVRYPKSKHAQNFVGLITHMWGKYGNRK